MGESSELQYYLENYIQGESARKRPRALKISILSQRIKFISKYSFILHKYLNYLLFIIVFEMRL